MPCVGNALAFVAAAVGALDIVGAAQLPSVTPHDELVNMGVVALNHHLHKCERELEGLQSQKEYAVASSGAQADNSEKAVQRFEDQLANMRLHLQKERNDTAARVAEIKAKVGNLTSQRQKLKDAYTAEYAEWWAVKSDVETKVAAMESCKCSEQALLLQRRQRRQLRGHSEEWQRRQQRRQLQLQRSSNVYDTARKVEQCEASVIAISGEIEAAQAAGRHAAIKEVEKIGVLKRRLVEQERMNKLLTKDYQLDGLWETYKTLAPAVVGQRAQVETLAKSTKKLADRLGNLEKAMQKCGC